ncbi:MAG: HAD hydrolase-like protein [Chlorobiota bacterium]|nr:HAD hydrolase-like protein [Chlorobiota bacterium]QQS67724.1 MAG: HAD hydrolase-like protein [Chlorobiota bacterium]
MKLLLFDIDGTLIRVKYSLIHKVIKDVFYKVNKITIPDTLELELHGKTDRQIFFEYGVEIGLTKIKISNILFDLETCLVNKWKEVLTVKNVTLLPGIKKLINDLSKNKNVKIGLVTGNLEGSVFHKLSPYDLNQYFSVGAFGSDSSVRNDLPPIAISRAERKWGHKFTNENIIIIGDSFRDIECAKVNNLKSLAVATGGLSLEQLKDYNPDFLVSNLEDRSVFNYLTT